MNKTSMIIRLIDVVLILLFGFIKISHIVFFSQIKLPASEQSLEQKDEQENETLLTVRVNSFLVNEAQVYMKFNISEGEQEIEFNNLEDLEDYLIKRAEKAAKQHSKFLVFIEPSLESLLQTTVDVMDICRVNNIEQSIKSPVKFSKQ